MNVVDIIAKKRDGEPLTTDEIKFFIEQYTAGQAEDYQAAAWAMAVYHHGMTREETVALTLAMAESGEMMDLSDTVPFAVDKHSSGGVGDKTSLVVLPMVAACGVPVAKMSGRGLGHTGGTLDKLESIEGFRVEISIDEFKMLARKNGIVLAGQTADLAPADKALYAIRDVTATVSSLPLIASSIMSKKIAAGADAIVLDVKAGIGAFMRNVDEAKKLAQIMVDIGVDAGRHMVALVSDMNQPLGVSAGLALEVKEAIATLHGHGPADFYEHCLETAAYMLILAPDSGVNTIEDARERVQQCIDDGSAFAKFRLMVEGQGGNVAQINNPDLLPNAQYQAAIVSPHSGYIGKLDALQVGMAVVALGGGRLRKSDPVDHGVGVDTLKNVGDEVASGEPIFILFANDEAKLATAQEHLEKSGFAVSETPVERYPLFYDVIRGEPV